MDSLVAQMHMAFAVHDHHPFQRRRDTRLRQNNLGFVALQWNTLHPRHVAAQPFYRLLAQMAWAVVVQTWFGHDAKLFASALYIATMISFDAMKCLCSAMLFSVAVLTHGQAITQPNLPDHGFSFTYAVTTMQPEGFDWSTAFAIQNVDFEFVPADSTAYADTFASADFAQQVPVQTGGLNLSFYEYNPDYFGFWGGVDGASGIEVVHPEAVKYLPYPFAAGDVHEDQLTFEFASGGMVNSRDFSINQEGMEFGTLQLSSGLSFNNTLRVATRTLTTDSNATSVSTLLTEGFQYWSQDMPLPVAQTYTYTQIVGTDSTVLFAAAEFVTDATTGFNLPNDVAFNAFPSPASHSLNVSGPTGSWVRVVDLQGRTLHRRQLQSDLEAWDVSEWPVGMHFLHIEGTSVTQRVLVVH